MAYTKEQAVNFINHIAPLMQSEAKKRGYKIVSTAIAQAIIEGAANTSSLAYKYHNHWGLKCGKTWLKNGKPSICLKTKEEYTPGTLTDISDFFRVFANDAEGVSGYYDFISISRYENLKTANTYTEYAERLKQDGYATSSTYISTLVKTVELYDLARFDKFIDYTKFLIAPQSEAFINKVNVEKYLNVRALPSVGEVTRQLAPGSCISAIGYQRGWIEIAPSGWVNEIYISSSHGVVTDIINVRKGNSTDYEIIGLTKKNSTVRILNELNGWYLIITPDGLFGWANSKWIEIT